MEKKKLFFSAIILSLVIAATTFYWYQKPRTSLTNVNADYALSANQLYTAFQTDEKKANQQYVEKVLKVTGTVDNVQETDSTVNLLLSGDGMGGINCSVRKDSHNKETTPAKGATVSVKGRCIGFLMDVNLVDAIIENQ